MVSRIATFKYVCDDAVYLELRGELDLLRELLDLCQQCQWAPPLLSSMLSCQVYEPGKEMHHPEIKDL